MHAKICEKVPLNMCLNRCCYRRWFYPGKRLKSARFFMLPLIWRHCTCPSVSRYVRMYIVLRTSVACVFIFSFTTWWIWSEFHSWITTFCDYCQRKVCRLLQNYAPLPVFRYRIYKSHISLTTGFNFPYQFMFGSSIHRRGLMVCALCVSLSVRHTFLDPAITLKKNHIFS